MILSMRSYPRTVSDSCLSPRNKGAMWVKSPHANAEDVRDAGLISGLGRSLGGRRGNPLQYPCLKNPMDRGNWGATVHRVAKSQTQLKQLSIYTKELFTDIIARLKVHSGDFPGGPVVKNLPCDAGNEGLIPCWGTKHRCCNS